MYESLTYTEVSSIETKICAARQQFIVMFTGEDPKIQGDAVLTISVIDNLPVLKFDVELFGIPQNKHVGQEVTVNFIAPAI